MKAHACLSDRIKICRVKGTVQLKVKGHCYGSDALAKERGEHLLAVACSAIHMASIIHNG